MYKSKISIGLLLFLFSLFGYLAFKILSNSVNQFNVLILLIPFIFIFYCLTSIRYTILNDNLNIKTGFLVNKTIRIATIKKIEETTNIISSPAASLDRLEVFYNHSDSIIISPKNKNQFLNNLLKINPTIEIKYKI